MVVERTASGIVLDWSHQGFPSRFCAALTVNKIQLFFAVFLAQMSNRFSQLLLQCPFQFRSNNGMSLKPSVHSEKLHLIVAYVLSNVPLNSVGDTVVFRSFALLFITFWNQREIEFCWDSLCRVSVLYPFHNFFVSLFHAAEQFNLKIVWF